MGNKMVWIDESLAAKLEIVNDVAKLKTDGDLDKVIKMLTITCEKPTPLGVGWIAHL